jgi:prepilin-type N-terminal cleavage/methylation domain-containing protein
VTVPQTSSLAPNDTGFSLLELLVVIIIIGVLAAIAVPVFLTQRAKAHDTSTKADVTNVGKEIATLFVDGTGATSINLDVKPGKAVITANGVDTTVNLTNGTAKPSAGAFSNLGDSENWCVSLTDPKGAVEQYRYHAQSGLAEGTC